MNNYNDKNRSLCVDKLNKIIEDIQLSRNIEKSIYNITINFTKDNNINCRWDNKIFYNLYLVHNK